MKTILQSLLVTSLFYTATYSQETAYFDTINNKKTKLFLETLYKQLEKNTLLDALKKTPIPDTGDYWCYSKWHNNLYNKLMSGIDYHSEIQKYYTDNYWFAWAIKEIKFLLVHGLKAYQTKQIQWQEFDNQYGQFLKQAVSKSDGYLHDHNQSTRSIEHTNRYELESVLFFYPEEQQEAIIKAYGIVCKNNFIDYCAKLTLTDLCKNDTIITLIAQELFLSFDDDDFKSIMQNIIWMCQYGIWYPKRLFERFGTPIFACPTQHPQI